MKLPALLIATLVLSSCSAKEQESAPIAQTPTILQCAKDTECKGDRICDNGTCKNPPSSIQAPSMESSISSEIKSSPLASSVRDTSEYKEAYSCAMDALKDGYIINCYGNRRDPSEIEEQAYKDAEHDFSNK